MVEWSENYIKQRKGSCIFIAGAVGKGKSRGKASDSSDGKNEVESITSQPLGSWKPDNPDQCR